MWRALARTEARLARAVLPDVRLIGCCHESRNCRERNLSRSACCPHEAETRDINGSTARDRCDPGSGQIWKLRQADGPSRFQFLDVRNLGKEAIFHAKGQIISSQNSNSFLTGVYPLGWGRNRDAWVAIPKGDTRQILIATIGEVYAGSLFHMALIQAGPSVERHWARWNAQDKLPLPRFGLKVSIIAEGAEESWTGYFSVTPENQEGGWCTSDLQRPTGLDRSVVTATKLSRCSLR